MVPPPGALTGGPGADRWSWVFGALAAAAAAPAALSAATVVHVLTDDGVQASVNGGMWARESGRPFADRWDVVTTLTQLTPPAATSAVALLALAAVVVSGRPGWLVRGVERPRLLVGALAAGCALWTALTTAVAVWALVTGPTARQRADHVGAVPSVDPGDRVVDGGLALLAVAVDVAVVVALVTTRERSHQRVGDDPRERARAE
ncbi:hypothetical protein [Kineococcus sp. SYSU DK001]|uniref:hypothetical protein n=1 Tax=Kineococcus sp. SYSU DK001 TaxID=3383122 RepID=UPI003D7EDB8F